MSTTIPGRAEGAPSSEVHGNITAEVPPERNAPHPFANDGRTTQSSLLVLAEADPDKLADLHLFLRELGRAPSSPDAVIPFVRLSDVHFARIVLFPAAPAPRVKDRSARVADPPIGPMLAFATDFDGSLDQHVDKLIAEAGPGLMRLFGFCKSPPGGTEAALRNFLAHPTPAQTSFVGAPGRSVGQIQRESLVREHIEAFLDERRSGPPPASSRALREEIIASVAGRAELRWALDPAPLPAPAGWARWLLRHQKLLPLLALTKVAPLLGVGALLFVCWLLHSWTLALAAALLGPAVLLYLSLTDQEDIREDKDHTRALAEQEDHSVQNQMSSVIFVKEPRWFRGLLLRAVLRVMHVAARHLFVQGALDRIDSIHFARWAIVDKGRRLIFFSNFDGTWESYLGEFVDRAHTGLTAVWSNCVGFPRTWLLTGGGAAAENKFKIYSRQSQTPTQVWYSAYPELTVSNIINNSRIRAGLAGVLDEEQAAQWIALL
jgi:hypothetical protein